MASEFLSLSMVTRGRHFLETAHFSADLLWWAVEYFLDNARQAAAVIVITATNQIWQCVTLTFAERFRWAVSLSGNKPLSAIDALFQVKLKLSLSKLLSTLKVIIDFANHFRSAEYAIITNLIWAKQLRNAFR